MRQVYREIKEQLTPDKDTVNELFDRINGRETPAVKTGGFRWVTAASAAAVFGLVLLGGLIGISNSSDIEKSDVNDSVTLMSEKKLEFGYPAAQVETPVEVDDGKFDFKNGGYYSMEKHQPEDPPDEETKKRLLKQNTDITIYSDKIRNSSTEAVSGNDAQTKHIYRADDDTFETFYHVSYISSYACMGKVKDGDRIYELLVAYTGFGPGTIAISFGDGKYYLYRIPDYDLEIEYAHLHIALGEETWGDTGEYAYNSVGSDNNENPLTDELFTKMTEYLENNADAVTVQLDDGDMKLPDGVVIKKDAEGIYPYKYGGVADRSEFDDKDVRSGFGTFTYSALDGTYYADYNAAINSPAEDGSILVLLPGDRVIKLVLAQQEE